MPENGKIHAVPISQPVPLHFETAKQKNISIKIPKTPN